MLGECQIITRISSEGLCDGSESINIVSTDPEDATDMLTYMVADDSVNHKAWVFHEYKGCDGNYTLFKSKAEAISYAKDNWDHMNRHDQLGYIKDSAGEFWVAELPVEWDDDLEKFEPDFSEYTPVWDAIKEYKEKSET